MEVAHICGRNTAAEFQSSHADQQVGKRQMYAERDIPSINLSRPKCHWNRYRVHRQSGHPLVKELLSRSSSFRRVGKDYTMCHFNQRNYRNGHIFAYSANSDLTQCLAGV